MARQLGLEPKNTILETAVLPIKLLTRKVTLKSKKIHKGIKKCSLSLFGLKMFIISVLGFKTLKISILGLIPVPRI